MRRIVYPCALLWCDCDCGEDISVIRARTDWTEHEPVILSGPTILQVEIAIGHTIRIIDAGEFIRHRYRAFGRVAPSIA